MFFFVFTILVNIIMLNLLIAIVSTSYETVLESQEEAVYYERAGILWENIDLVS